MALRKLVADAAWRLGTSLSSGQHTSFLARVASSSPVSRAFATVMDDCKYAESHEWVKVEGDTATIGISDFAQGELGDVVHVELPDQGDTFAKEESFAVLESVKTASDVYMPVSGEVTAVNEELLNEPGKINEGPYTDGWLVKVKMSNSADTDSLMDSGAYAKHIEA